MHNYTCRFLAPEQLPLPAQDLPVWFNPEFMAAIAALFNIKPMVCLCCDGDNPVALLPFYEKSKLGLKQAYNPLLVYYSPLNILLPVRKHNNRTQLQTYEIGQAMAETLKKNYWRVLLNLTPDTLDIRCFQAAGFSVQTRYTYWMHLQSEPEFFPPEQRAIRKAEKAGFGFIEEYVPEAFLDMLSSLYERKQHPFPIGRIAHLELLDRLHAHNLIKQYNVRDETRVIGSILVIPDKNGRIYGWQSATQTQAQKSGASIFLYSQLFNLLKSDYRIMDLCGANAQGPSRLKAALGAELKVFFQIRKH